MKPTVGHVSTAATRIAGALIGHAAGDALGATCEFATPAEITHRYGRHRDITGGGRLGWRPGQGTDDTDLSIALARTYAYGYSLGAAADALAAWYARGPRDVGGTTARALAHYQAHGDPHASGRHTWGPRAAGNGSTYGTDKFGRVSAPPHIGWRRQSQRRRRWWILPGGPRHWRKGGPIQLAELTQSAPMPLRVTCFSLSPDVQHFRQTVEEGRWLRGQSKGFVASGYRKLCIRS